MSCHRTATPAGYSSISAVLQLDNDGRMQGVEDNVGLPFDFLREPRRSSRGGCVGAAAPVIDDIDNDDDVEDDANGGGRSEDGDGTGDRKGVERRRRNLAASRRSGSEGGRECADRITPEPDELQCLKNGKRTDDDVD